MGTQSKVLRGMPALLMAAGILVSCVRERAIGPAATRSPRGAEGIREEPVKAAQESVAVGTEHGGFDASWYERAKRPRILVVVNRRFAGDASLWRADTRLVLSTRGGKTVRIGETPKADLKTLRAQQEIQTERRTDSSVGLFPESMSDRLRAALMRQFLAAGCAMVDPDVAERIAQAAASHAEGAEAGRQAIDVSTEAFLKDADWIIEAVTLPSRYSDMPYFISAKVVDLQSRRVLAVQSTLDMPRRLPLAGTNQPLQVTEIEEQADWLAGALSRQLAVAIKQP